MKTTERGVRGTSASHREDTGHESDRRDKAQKLLLIPEIDQALDELLEIRKEYWNALFSALISSSDEDFSDLEPVANQYYPRLKRNVDAVSELIRKHAA